MHAGICAEGVKGGLPVPAERCWRVEDYRLDLTLDCGQAFRWSGQGRRWQGVVRGRWVELEQDGPCLRARVCDSGSDWSWLEDYLQLRVSLAGVFRTFPPDRHLEQAVARWRGLRLLRQPFWECLASFLLSSSKRIDQIRQVIERLCRHWGDPVPVPTGHQPAWSFPEARRLADVPEARLRTCGMGFRAAYLQQTARRVLEQGWEQTGPPGRNYAESRALLMRLPGVGPKIADCVCLFALGFMEAFPVDTWVARVLRERYFGGRPVSPERLAEFGRAYFGPWAGYAQQYLFHDRRSVARTGVSSGAV